MEINESLHIYEVRREKIQQDGKTITMLSAYNKDGKYIGNPATAQELCEVRGIVPEAMEGNEVCSIGFCENEQKWYGWSHRAVHGFGIGATVKDGDVIAGKFKAGFIAKTLDDAKFMAMAFADEVS